MDNLLIIVLAVIDAMVALLLIGVVLVQQSKDGGFGGSPFGGAGDAVFGGQTANHLTKITVILASIFLILTLSLAIITGRRSLNDAGVVEETATDKQAQITPMPQPETKKQAEQADIKIIDKLDDVKSKSEATAKTKASELKTTAKKIDETAKSMKTTPAKK